MKYYLLLFSLLLLNCSKIESNSTTHVPTQLDRTDSLKTLSLNAQQLDTVILKKELVFESNDQVFIEGFISDFSIDRSNNLHIYSDHPGKVAIYSFDAEGNYLGKMGRYGRGPGEFEAIASIYTKSDTLYALDPRLKKLSIFSMSEFKHIRDIMFNRDVGNHDEAQKTISKANNIYGIHKEEYIISFRRSNFLNLNEYTEDQLYLVSKSGNTSKYISIDIPKYLYNNPEGFKNTGPNPLGPFGTPFSRSSRIAINNSEEIYMVWTEDFLIKKFNVEQGYTGGFYFPYSNAPLSLNELDISERRKKYLRKEGIPNTWPAIHTIELDDQGQIWVATITESDSYYQWYVIGNDGEFKASFTWAGNKKDYNPVSQPKIKIQDGYIYKREVDFDKEINRIVKYSIAFKKRE